MTIFIQVTEVNQYKTKDHLLTFLNYSSVEKCKASNKDI